MPEQPMGAGCGVILLIACWLISLLCKPPQPPHPILITFPLCKQSELNSLQEESFHVLIFDLKTYQRVLSVLLGAKAFLQTLGTPGRGTTFYLLPTAHDWSMYTDKYTNNFVCKIYFLFFETKNTSKSRIGTSPGGFQMCHCSVLYMSIKEF